MKESEYLTEGSYVYTDLGIEQVHWCEVNGEKELVTPKGYILGEVPSVNRHFQLVGENAILIAQNAQLKELLKECAELMDSTGTIAMHIDVYRQRKKDVLNTISQVLGEKE